MGLAFGVAIVVGADRPRRRGRRRPRPAVRRHPARVGARADRGPHPRPLPARARRDDPGRLCHVLRHRRGARLHRRAEGDQPGPGDHGQPAGIPRFGPVLGIDAATGDPRTIDHRACRLGPEHPLPVDDAGSRTRWSRSAPRRPRRRSRSRRCSRSSTSGWSSTPGCSATSSRSSRPNGGPARVMPGTRSRRGSGLWVRGQLILMGTMGLATGMAYTVLGLPGALLLALIAALAEAIPIIGPLLGAIPAVLVAATVSPELAVIVAGVYIVIQLVEGSVLVPMVMRNTIGLSPLLVLLSLLVGAAVGGLVGAFLAVPDRRLDRDRAGPAAGARVVRRPGPGRDRDPRRGGARRVRAVAPRCRGRPGRIPGLTRVAVQTSAATAIPRECSPPRRSTSRRHSASRPASREGRRPASDPRMSRDRQPPADVRAVRRGSGRCRPSRGSRRRPPTRWPSDPR